MNKSNIFALIPKKLPEELFEDIIKKDALKIERIVSYGHTTTEGEWYEQEKNEWVILLKGEAILSFEDEDDIRFIAGDYLNIPALKKHRVSWTKLDEKSVWLVILY